jgi:succinyl-CoA synthetase beta subunit
MKLHEYMGKELFHRYGIPIPKGQVAFSPEQASEITEQIGEVVIKSQILSGKRGKAGGIRFTKDPVEAARITDELIGSDLRGFIVQAVLVEEKLSIEKEYYLAVTIDRESKCPVILASAEGGMDIEEVDPSGIVTFLVDPVIGLMPFMVREIAEQLSLPMDLRKQFYELLNKLYSLFSDMDAELVEINPLVRSGVKLIAADAKITIDEDALYRQTSLPTVEERSVSEASAKELGLAFVDLEGDIGVMANGAGITMATLDLLDYYGGAAANFLDAGGGAGEEATTKALELVLERKPNAILINIFGGITRCDDVARAIASVKRKMNIKIPLVVRLVGTNQEEGWKILSEVDIKPFSAMHEAAKSAVELAALTAKERRDI